METRRHNSLHAALCVGTALFFSALLLAKLVFNVSVYPDDDGRAAFFFTLLAAPVVAALLFWILRRRTWPRPTFPILIVWLVLSRFLTAVFFSDLTPITDAKNYMGIAQVLYEDAMADLHGGMLWLQLAAAFCVVLTVAACVLRRRAVKNKFLSRVRDALRHPLLPFLPVLAWVIFCLFVLPGLAAARPDGVSVRSFELYIQVFPHFFGYPAVVTAARLLLQGVWDISLVNTALGLNAVLGVGMGLLVFDIARQAAYALGARPEAARNRALTALFVWSVWPSQIFYTALPLAEMTYVFFLLLSICCFARCVRRRAEGQAVSAAAYGLYGALSCAAARFIRPHALILVVALVLWWGIHGVIGWRARRKNTSGRDILLSAVRPGRAARRMARASVWPLAAVLLFVLTGTFFQALTESFAGQTASSPLGWNLYDGLNRDRDGRWNAEDNRLFSALFTQVQSGEISPDALHATLLDAAKTRLLQNGAGNLPLFARKAFYMWYQDEVSLTYATDLKPFLGLRDPPTLLYALRGLCTGYYVAMLLFFIHTLWRRRRTPGFPFENVLLLYIVGTILLHLLLEQSQRYAFPASALMAVLVSVPIIRTRKTDTNQGVV